MRCTRHFIRNLFIFFFFCCSLLRLTGCLHSAPPDTALWLQVLNFLLYIQD